MFTAEDVMVTTFHTLRPDVSVAEAAKLFEKATVEEGRRVFGMIVLDESGGLAGMLSMYDILLFVRPKHVEVWGMMEDLDVGDLMDTVRERAKHVLVGDIMTTDVITATPDTHVMALLDIMIKKHIRRIPVERNDKIEGIVYLSDLFAYLMEKMTL